MKKLILIVILSFLSHINAISQPCLPNGITFNTQAEIDSFPINYPNCNMIGGNVDIIGSSISNLNGLSVLILIDGRLIINSTLLKNLNGLNNLNIIGFYCRISYNDSLTSLTGLDNVNSIGGSIRIINNGSLTSLTGLENLTTIQSYIEIENNTSLTSLTGLNNVTYMGHIGIINNPLLTSLTGLDNVTTIQGYMEIENNTSLTSLTGLNNVSSIFGDIDIINNSSLTSLSGLDNLTFNWGYFNIEDNDALTSFAGLDNLTSIDDYLNIGHNTALTSLTGLENLSSIGEGLHIYYNDALSSITGLNNLTTIDGHLWIENNVSLTSLLGLDNIDESTITNLYIYNNYMLSECEVQSVCDYLASPNGIININTNSSGCNNQSEVDSICASASYSIYGNVGYGDTLTPHQAINNALLILHNTNGITVDSTITDANGDYQFNNLSDGTYYIQTICTKAWGGGSASDAVAIMWHFAKLLTFTGINEKAGDVDGSGYLNSLDALYIAHRFVFLITSFPAGDWVFEEDLIAVNGSNVLLNIKGLCVGDVNASFVVPFK